MCVCVLGVCVRDEDDWGLYCWRLRLGGLGLDGVGVVGGGAVLWWLAG